MDGLKSLGTCINVEENQLGFVKFSEKCRKLLNAYIRQSPRLIEKALQGIPGSQRLQIRKAYDSPQHLPSAHACFNRLDLPECTSEEQLRRRLLLAINEANEGFGIG
ncbi:PPR repeat [Musa troglodytarum]|uniref:HECT-type E3 ubiquitin transferase n=1 Tax=Musa troglodytarum TaxID=320322 RepID=A0A9E7L2Q2_9LILI|nr:PPR repeat [Musa troglodytarum]